MPDYKNEIQLQIEILKRAQKTAEDNGDFATVDCISQTIFKYLALIG